MEQGDGESIKLGKLKKDEAMKKLREIISSLPETEPIGDKLVREDRDNN
jgi:hypothetical protein